MSLPIVFAPGVQENIAHLVKWAGQHSSAARLKLLAAMVDKLQLIEQNPQMYAVLPERPAVRRCVILPTVSLFYRIQPTAIEILAVADTRRDPDTFSLPA